MRLLLDDTPIRARNFLHVADLVVEDLVPEMAMLRGIEKRTNQRNPITVHMATVIK